MYAVVKTGGKQYRVSEGDVVRVEKLTGDVGVKVTLEVLMIGGSEEIKIGRPTVAGAAVDAEIVDQGRHAKVIHASRIKTDLGRRSSMRAKTSSFGPRQETCRPPRGIPQCHRDEGSRVGQA